MEGSSAFLYFQKFCSSSGRGQRDLLHFSISRNSAFLEVGWRDLLHFSFFRNSALPEVGVEGPTTFLYFQKFSISRGRGWGDWRDLVPRFPGILYFQGSGVEGPSATISRNSVIPGVGGGGP